MAKKPVNIELMVDYSELTAKEARQSGESEGIGKVLIFIIMSVVDPY